MTFNRGLFALKDATRGTTALEARLALAQLITGTTGLAARPGVLPVSDIPTALVAGTAGWAYEIAPAAFVMSRGAADGVILATLDAIASVACSAAPGSNSRYDLIWVRHPSNGEYSETDSIPVAGVTEGTPSATPSKPYGSVPTGALVLAEALLASTDADTSEATITQVFPYTALRGTPIVVRNTTERDALDASATAPARAWRLDATAGKEDEISTDGVSWAAVGDADTPTIQVFTASGTWTKPARLKAVRIEVQGGGGAGGGAAASGAGQHSHGGGGGGGGNAESLIPAATLSATETVTVGAGGTGVSSAAGNAGAASSLGTHVVAAGGAGGLYQGVTAAISGANGGAGGTGTTGQILTSGQAGQRGLSDANATTGLAYGGAGGASRRGSGGQGDGAGGGAGGGAAGGGFGGGGAGAVTMNAGAAQAGGPGAPGLVVVYEYF